MFDLYMYNESTFNCLPRTLSPETTRVDLIVMPHPESDIFGLNRYQSGLTSYAREQLNIAGVLVKQSSLTSALRSQADLLSAIRSSSSIIGNIYNSRDIIGVADRAGFIKGEVSDN